MPSQKITTGHEDLVHDAALDYYGKRLATASSDATVRITAISGNNQHHLATLSGHLGPVFQVAWSHPKHGSLLASSSYDGRVIIWSENPSNPNHWSQAHVSAAHSSVNSISWAPHDIYPLSLACASSDGSISVLSLRPDGSWASALIPGAHPVGVTSVSWAPSSAPGALVVSDDLPIQKLVSGGCDSCIKIWKLRDGDWELDRCPVVQIHTDWVRDVAWAPSLGMPKATIASASQDGTAVIWTVVGGGEEEERWEGNVLKDFKTPVWRVSWSLSGDLLAVTDGNGGVTLWKEGSDGEWQQVSTVEP